MNNFFKNFVAYFINWQFSGPFSLAPILLVNSGITFNLKQGEETRRKKPLHM